VCFLQPACAARLGRHRVFRQPGTSPVPHVYWRRRPLLPQSIDLFRLAPARGRGWRPTHDDARCRSLSRPSIWERRDQNIVLCSLIGLSCGNVAEPFRGGGIWMPALSSPVSAR